VFVCLSVCKWFSVVATNASFFWPIHTFLLSFIIDFPLPAHLFHRLSLGSQIKVKSLILIEHFAALFALARGVTLRFLAWPKG